MTADDPVVRRYLATSFVARVATCSSKGVPALTPLWFVVDGGRIYTTTAQSTLAARNAKADPNVAILFDGEGEVGGVSDEVLRVRGRARVHGVMPSLRVLARFAHKYYLGGWRSELRHARCWGLRQRYYTQSEVALIEVVPESAELLRAPGVTGRA